jgi:hypothetical protein
MTVMYDFREFYTRGADVFFQAGAKRFLRDFLFSAERLPLTIITMLGFLGLSRIWGERGDRLVFFAFFGQVCFLLGVTYLGSSCGLSRIQPYRFNASATIFLLPLAAHWIVCRLHGRQIGGQGALKIALVSLMLFPAFGEHFYNNYSKRHVDAERTEIRRLTTTMPAELAWMLEWIERNTDKRSRIAIQEVGKVPPIGNSHFMPLVALVTGREIIGNYHYESGSVYSVAAIDEDFVGVPFEMLTLEKVAEICRTYNIGTIILHDRLCRERMRDFEPIVKSVAEHGVLEVYRVAIEPSFVLIGTGEVRSDLNRLEVKEAGGPKTILKYHYSSVLRTEPELPIQRYEVVNDPVGFIEVSNGDVSEFEIYTDYSLARGSLRP